ncbi:MAG TPA: hypothetical protein VHL31_19735 [Geminicoccus sp.]|jgi:hypothetical protein|uniref:hypothetical protein n=1 Tax=Geminicoccus sp. TaxID=2024832 RepID=UPI002E3129FA|nr:hypothetical protein [Geminicoccus sp.]HEX2528516.1 hypothetical protein [Geminicoccus sp.]
MNAAASFVFPQSHKEEGTDKAGRSLFRQFCQSTAPGMQENNPAALSRKTAAHYAALLARGAPSAQPQREHPAFVHARVRGWHVEDRVGGVLVDTNGCAVDPDLFDQLQDMMELAWPTHLLGDEAEVVLRGELDEIEQEYVQ